MAGGDTDCMEHPSGTALLPSLRRRRQGQERWKFNAERTKWLNVETRLVVYALCKQIRLLFVPVFERLNRRLML
jgi:hypothetical protein